MLLSEALPFVTAFVAELDTALRRLDAEAGLTRRQKGWLGFCLGGILVTNSVCWKRFERASLGGRTHASLSWMFRQTRRFWQGVFQASVSVILARYAITQGVLVVDDFDKKRSKQTTRIYRAHKVKETKSGGFLNGQNVVVVLLVTPRVTLPGGVELAMPDPAVTTWNKEEARLRKRGVAKQQRPVKPPKNPMYPTKLEVALRLLVAFHATFPQIVVRCVLADAF